MARTWEVLGMTGVSAVVAVRLGVVDSLTKAASDAVLDTRTVLTLGPEAIVMVPASGAPDARVIEDVRPTVPPVVGGENAYVAIYALSFSSSARGLSAVRAALASMPSTIISADVSHAVMTNAFCFWARNNLRGVPSRDAFSNCVRMSAMDISMNLRMPRVSIRVVSNIGDWPSAGWPEAMVSRRLTSRAGFFSRMISPFTGHLWAAHAATGSGRTPRSGADCISWG